MSGEFVSGLVLAAGASSRLGQPKQLLPFRGTTLLGWVVEQHGSCPALDEVIVVLGNAIQEVSKQVSFGNAKIVENLGAAQGCSSSYRVGIGALNPEAQAMVVLLGDQPGVDHDCVHAVVSSWKHNGGKIVLANYRGQKGHPMLFSRELFDQLIGLHGDKAVWKLVDQHPEWVREVPIDRDRPRDINTWEDYQAMLVEL